MVRGNPSLGSVAFSLDKEDRHDNAHVLLKVLQKYSSPQRKGFEDSYVHWEHHSLFKL